MDWVLYDPAGNAIHKEDAITSTEITAPGVGGQGPWKACFKVSRRHLLRPSVMVEITHFTVNSPSLVGTHFEWQRPAPKGSVPLDLSTVKPGELGTTDQVEGLAEGLQRLDYYIHNVTNEQRYLSRRADRHMQTVRSTHARTLWYYIALYLTIVAASFAQARFPFFVVTVLILWSLSFDDVQLIISAVRRHLLVARAGCGRAVDVPESASAGSHHLKFCEPDFKLFGCLRDVACFDVRVPRVTERKGTER